jgi:hypothetical protein
LITLVLNSQYNLPAEINHTPSVLRRKLVDFEGMVHNPKLAAGKNQSAVKTAMPVQIKPFRLLCRSLRKMAKAALLSVISSADSRR